ncbi:MAG: hypothetical protein JWL90_3257 [Chthoniobacteraceae bacterium]|nr:hypothetical protein [Chthoniobacteraceae bacterium]
MTEAAAYREFLLNGGIADLSDRVKLALKGADRVRYLNGQVTSNVTKLRETQSACVTTAKGRLCAEIMVTAAADVLFVDADAALAETLPARLERYIVADDVELVELPSDTRLLHFLGVMPSVLEKLAGGAPLQRSRRYGIDGWDLWTNAGTLAAIRLEGVAFLSDSLLETIRIEHGIARWGYELDEETLPPEAGLERTHIDYHKGCYIGQEVISRLKSIGHVNRQLTGFISNDAPLASGMRIFNGAPVGEGMEPKPIGTITSAAWSFALEKPVALGYLRRGAAIEGLVARLPGMPGVSITAQALPFVS